MKFKIAIVAAVAALAAVAMTTAAGASPRRRRRRRRPAAGGTYRVEWNGSFNFTDGFDPTGEYLGDAFGIYSNLLVRTLVGYNHVKGAPGNKLVPDLATDLGKVSNGGKTYTFQSSRASSSARRSTARSPRPTSSSPWSASRIRRRGRFDYAFSLQRGQEQVDAGYPTDTSSTTSPSRSATSATASAMPAAGPMPKEVAGCFTEAGKYGRDVISSGPYMIEGSDKLDASSCDKVAASPISGFDGEKQ